MFGTRSFWAHPQRVFCWAIALVAVVSASCSGGGGGGGTPTAPTPQANRSPTVSGVTVTPAFGIQNFGLFTFNAVATDLDGDTLTYAWDIGGNSRTGSTAQIGPFGNGGTFPATVTVTDGRGGSATGAVQFIVGTMTGTWTGAVLQTNAIPSFTMVLTQAAGLFAGTMQIPGLALGEVGPSGAIATINATGQVSMRIKIAPFQDFTMTGQMDGTGRTVTGSVSGSGFTGQPFTMTKQ